MKFKMLRIKSGFTQNNLAKEMNINQTTISNWENGLSSPKRKMVKKLAEILNASVSEIIDCFE